MATNKIKKQPFEGLSEDDEGLYFSLHADPDAWNFKPICYDCVNKKGGSCYIFGKDGEAPDPTGILEAQSTGKCEWYIKHTKV